MRRNLFHYCGCVGHQLERKKKGECDNTEAKGKTASVVNSVVEEKEEKEMYAQKKRGRGRMGE